MSKTEIRVAPVPTEKSTPSWAKRTIGVVIFVAVAWFLDSIKHRWYVFEPTELHRLAQAAVSANPGNAPAIIDHIVTNLTATYPASAKVIALNPNSKSEWVLNNAGGAMGAMYIIHASITEYLIIFGTPLGTEGHTGWIPVDNYFNIIIGEQWAFRPGALEKEVYRPGDVNFQPKFTPRQYKMHTECFALEYSRGWIPLTLFFGFADVIFSTLDPINFFRTIWFTAREMLRNLLIGKI